MNAIINRGWGLACAMVLLLVMGTVAPAAAAPSPNCPNPIPFNVPFGGSVTQDLGFCDGGLGIGIGPLQPGGAPTQGTVSFSKKAGSVLDELVTYTHTGDGSVLTDTFVFNDGDGFDVTVNVTIQPPTSSIVIAPASLPPMRVGASYSTSVEATGGVGPYTYTSTGTLPPGISLASDGTLSGTPTERRPSSFNVIATDSTSASAQRAYTITPADPIYVINPVPNGTQNVAFNRTLTVSGGIAPYNVNYLSGTLPPGVAVAGDTLSGTPTATGTYNIVVRVTDSSAGTFPYQMDVPAALTINPPTVITVNPATVGDGTVGDAYTQTITASGGTAPYIFDVVAGSLPPGLTLEPTTGVLSGVPTDANGFAFTVRATDFNNAQGTRAYTMAVFKPILTISPVTIPSGAIGSAYSQAITVSGGLAPYTFSATGLPAGLTLSTAGVLTGTPTQAGTFSVEVTVLSSGTGQGAPFTESQPYTLSIVGPTQTIAPAAGTLPGATYNAPYSQAITAAGGTEPYTYAATGTLPPGVTLSTAGVLSGTPTAPGTYLFTVEATDASTGAGAPFRISAAYSLTVTSPTIVVSPTSLPAPVIGAPYAQQLSASGGAGAYTFAVTSGALPSGVTLQTDGSFTGAPTASGSFTFVVTASDENDQTGDQSYTVVVATPTLVLSPAAGALPNGTAGASYSQTFSASGGTSPYTFTNVGAALPAGLTLSTGGVLSGTPTESGNFVIEVRAEDGTSGTAGSVTEAYSLSIAAPTIVPGTLSPDNAQVGIVYSATLTASGGITPYTFNVVTGALPSGVTLSTSGTLAGTPTEAGTFAFSVEISDSTAGTAGTATVGYVLEVEPPTLSLSPASGALGGATANASYTHDFAISGGTAPYSAVITTGSLPQGMTLSSAGILSGTATESGNFSFTVSATDSTPGVAGQISGSYTLSVTPPALTMTPGAGILPGGRAGEAYSLTYTTDGGIAPYSYTLVAGSLPAGMNLSNDGLLTGMPTATGTFNLIITSRDSTSGTAGQVTQPYQITVAAPTLGLSPAGGALPSGTAGTSYQTEIIGSGGTTPYTFDVVLGALPPGITLDTDGSLAGVPTASGTYSFSVRMSDSTAGGTYVVNGAYQISIAAPTLTLSPAAGALPGATAGASYSQQVTASGGLSPYTYSVSAGALPTGVSLDGSGLLSGTPTSSGIFNFSIQAEDSTAGGAGVVTQAYSINVAVPTLTITPPAGALPGGTSGTAYTTTLSASGGIAPYSFSFAGPAPAFLTLAADGTLSGTPTGTGTYTFDIEVTDSTGGTAATQVDTYTLTIDAPTLTLSPAAGALTPAVAGTAYQTTFTGGNGVAPYTYTVVAGALPAGLTLSTAGVLEGTPTASGSFNLTVEVRDSTTGTQGVLSQAYTLQVGTATLSLAPASGALPGATAGEAYSQTFTASAGIAPYGYSVTAGAVPAGMSLASDGTLSGTPTASGTFNFTVTAQDATTGTPAFISQAYSLTVAVPAITLAPAGSTLPSATAGTAYSQAFTATGGIAPYAFTITAGALPAGLALDGAGTLSGTPSASGSFTFTVAVTDSTSGTPAVDSRAYTLVVDVPALSLSPAAGALPAGTAGTAYTQSFSASGGVAPYTYAITAGAVPTGLSLSSSGELSGTPTASGTFNFSVTATDTTGGTSATITQAYSLQIGTPALTVLPASGALTSGVAGVAYSVQFDTTGGQAPYSYDLVAGALPTGLTLSATGALSGTPTAVGTFAFDVQVTDSTGGTPAQQVQSYTLTVASPTLTLAPAAGALPGAVAGTAYDVDFVASGGIAPYSYAVTAGTLPTGLTLSASGALSGTPTQAGAFNFTVQVSDSAGGAVTVLAQAYTLEVAPPALTLAPAAGALPTATAGDAYSQTFTASGGAAPYTYTLSSGTLAAGMTLSSAGTLSGTPTSSGTFTISVRAVDSTDGVAAEIVQTYTLTVGSPTLTLAPAAGALPAATAGTAYSQQFTADGGIAPYSYAIGSGALPAGLTLSAGGLLSGTPTASGTFNVTITATDSTGGSAATISQAYSLTVAAPTLTLAPAAGALPAAVAGDAYSQQFTAAGGITPYTYTVASGTLPAGLSLSSTGLLSGTPTASGSFSFSVEASDGTAGTPATITQAYTLSVGAPTLSLLPAAGALPAGTAGTAYNQVFTADGGIAPYSYAVVAGALPAGLTLSAAGTLSGTPTVAGTFNVSIQATDSTTGTAAQITQAYSLTIDAPQIAITPTSLADGVRGTAYTADFTATGGVGSYTWSIGAGSLPAGLTLSASGSLQGTPTVAGTSSFQVVATDSLGFTGAVALTLQIIEAVPVAVDDTATTLAEQAVTIDVTANDTGVITSITLVQPPTNGTAVISGLDVVYTPADGYAGSDSLRYTATGPGGTSLPATVSITVTALPVPVVPDQAATVLAGSAVRIDATAGASGGPFTTVAVVEAPADGTVTVEGTTLVYTAPASAEGSRLIRYTVSNAFGASAPATATITVNPLPQALPQERDVIAGGSVQVDLTAGATGGPFTGANVVALTPSNAGDVRVERSGQAWLLTFTPTLQFAGVATVSFTLDNAYATSAPALVSFNVTPRSDPSKDAEVLGLLDAQAATTRRFATAQIGNFQQRLERLHGAGEGGSGFQNGLGFQVDRACQPGRGTVIGDPCRTPAVSDEQSGYSEPLPYTRDTANTSLGLWTGGMISSGSADSRSGREGLDFESSGVSAGADYRVSPDFAIGAGVGYGQDRTDVGNNGTRSDGDAYTMAVYASYHPGRHLFVDWLAGYQLLGFENRRYVTDTGAMVGGKRDGTQWFASLSAGADFQKDRWQWSPYARLDAARAQLDGYTESGTDSGHTLDFRRQDVDTTTISAGFRMSYASQVAWGRLSPQVRMEYQRELEDPSSAAMSYADLPGGPLYQADVRGFKRNRFVFGAGLVLAAERDLMFRIEYRGLFGDSEQRDNGLMLNIEKKY